MTLAFFAFLAGLLTILSPCALPLAPIVVASARAEDPRGPFALAAGLAAAFGISGGLLASAGVEAGEAFGLRVGAAVLMLAVGALLLVPAAGDRLTAALEPLVARFGAAQAGIGRGLAGQFALGGLLAIGWAPCAGPTLGAAFTLAAKQGNFAGAVATMAVYALGAAASLLAVGFGVGRFAGRFKTGARASGRYGRFALGGLLALTGILSLTGYDLVVEAKILDVMPDWLARLAGGL